MRTCLRIATPAAAFLLASFSIGCSSVGSTLGFSPPQHKLLPEAKAFRESTPPAGPRELAKILHPAHVVEPGDVLLVQPVELDSPVRLPADQTVLPDGTIDLSPFGRPVVAGKTVADIERDVQQLVKKQAKDAGTVTVRLIGRNSKVYYVLGEVNAPGVFPVTGRETVLDGIIAAGGLTRKASERSIVVSRPTPPDGCRIVMPVCYPQIVQLGDTSTNYQIMPGDRIYVPSQTLTEGLFPRRQKPGPCCGPQTNCAGGGCATPEILGSSPAPAVPAAPTPMAATVGRPEPKLPAVAVPAVLPIPTVPDR